MTLLLVWWVVSLLTWVLGCLWILARYKKLEWIDMLGIGVFSVVPVLAWMLWAVTLWKDDECENLQDY